MNSKFSLIQKYGKAMLITLLFCAILSTGFSQKILFEKDVRMGAEQMEVYLPMLKGKNIAVVANQTSVIGKTHLVDTLLSRGVKIKRVFAPEHGFRGGADAGEHVKNYKDTKTGLPIVSLYGDHKKPKPADLKDIDVVIFDIQDVGARFYTYISTMHYVMEACAEDVKDVIVLDRPNPNGFYIDGPILESKYKSFVGMHPIPLVHGLTVGELAEMINEEGWLKNGVKCALDVIPCEGYTHKDFYQLPIKPSPNLPNMSSIYLYPSLGLFEGTVISVGRGTELPFQCIGNPELKDAPYEFIPISTPGAKDPPFKGERCRGFNLAEFGEKEMKEQKNVYLHWLLSTYQSYPIKDKYFLENNFINLLIGNSSLRQQVMDGKTEKEIKETWQSGLNEYKKLRKKYLLYADFE